MNDATVFVVLGSPNSPLGILSTISKNRLDYCLEHIQKEDVILCTGGWGPQFNTSEIAHETLAKEYLIANGIAADRFLKGALSSNTVEDAVKVKEICSEKGLDDLTIVTSDYHLERVKLIFNEILAAYKLNFIGVKSTFSSKEIQRLEQHEKRAIQGILENGLYY